MAALQAVDRFSVPADGGMSAWLPIRVRSFPVITGGVLRLDVSLPPGSDKGPRILRRVLVVLWFTDDDTFITSDEALISYNPILPEQTSPFEVMTQTNPAMSRFLVEFKTLLGGT